MQPIVRVPDGGDEALPDPGTTPAPGELPDLPTTMVADAGGADPLTDPTSERTESGGQPTPPSGILSSGTSTGPAPGGGTSVLKQPRPAGQVPDKGGHVRPVRALEEHRGRALMVARARDGVVEGMGDDSGA